ncbi:MAG: diguanylate cyclase [Micavibrio aeruginosavorus]|nr:diguanylate cyclase [Micavibrio aeruginosavorus]
MSARVLVVDDILPNVKLLEAKLSSEYYDVLTASSGEEALVKIQNDSPDIITALTDSADKVRGLQAGADDFLSKPVNDTALMARVRSLVRLKMTVDEWRVRENTASQFGVTEEKASVMNEPVEGASILLVEDQDFESDKIIATFRQDNDSVQSVKTGMQAMEYAASQDFDLMIVSLNLRAEDGLRLCSHLRSNERTRSVPILMLATEDDMGRVAHGLEIGVHDYILRPIDRNEILARARTQIRRKRFQDRLRANYEVSLSMALTDSLTGLYNRRYMEVHLQKLLQKNELQNKNLCVLLLDIDHFKSINDSHGHAIGDEVLKTFAFRLKDSLRSFDLVTRLGGEEFVAILPDITVDLAHLVAERLRRSIAEKPFKCGAKVGALTVTTSIGGAIIEAGNHSVQSVLDRADKALYEAKNSGRHCTVFEGDGKLDPNKFHYEERQMIE